VIPGALANAASASVNGAIFNTFGCVAAAPTSGSGTASDNLTYSATVSYLGLATWEAGTAGYTGWWCSNGLYKKNTTSGTNILNATTIIS